MTTEVLINIKDKKNPPELKFSARCVRCGRQQETMMKIGLNMGVQKRSSTVMMDVVVPLCNDCAKKERSITKVTLVPFFVVGFMIGAVVFVIVSIISPAGTSSQTLSLPFVLGGAAGLIIGLIGGTLVEFVLKFVFAPVYGQLLLKRPLTIFSVFNDSEDVIGLSFRFGEQKKSLKLIFENEDIASEFINLNPQEKI
ncbi:MAG: hypothetical protein H7Y59_19580 [Anaerolineales bacterium]|nr:hypothetical protein [Anaerolineales bacterium]